MRLKFPKPGIRKKNKFGNHIIRDPVTGKKAYDSKLERHFHTYLKFKESNGEIKEVTQWPSVELLPGIRYKPDFKYQKVDTDETIWVDTKGVIGERYRIIRKLWGLFGPGTLHEVTKKHGGWHTKVIKSKEYIINEKE